MSEHTTSFQLQNGIRAFEQDFERYVNEKSAGIDAVATQHRRDMRALKRQAEQLRIDQRAFNEILAEQNRKIVTEKKETDRIKIDVAKLEEEVRSLPAELDTLEKKQTQRKAELEKRREDVAQTVFRNNATVEALKTSLLAFKECLGLDFQCGDGVLKLAFTLIDKDEPQKVFAFSVHIGADNRYVLDGCSPPIPRVESLIAELNDDNNFSGFVQKMRKAFCQLAASLSHR